MLFRYLNILIKQITITKFSIPLSCLYWRDYCCRDRANLQLLSNILLLELLWKDVNINTFSFILPIQVMPVYCMLVVQEDSPGPLFSVPFLHILYRLTCLMSQTQNANNFSKLACSPSNIYTLPRVSQSWESGNFLTLVKVWWSDFIWDC